MCIGMDLLRKTMQDNATHSYTHMQLSLRIDLATIRYIPRLYIESAFKLFTGKVHRPTKYMCFPCLRPCVYGIQVEKTLEMEKWSGKTT